MSTASDLLENYQHVVKSLTFTTGSKGIFDVTVDGELLYSKAVTGRHAESGEVLQLFTEKYGQGVIRYAQT
ncbi:MAG: Rdx family protein [Actinobacteria bacterium]|nr:Rdx family protein [Actinomycetota bacterium]